MNSSLESDEGRANFVVRQAIVPAMLQYVTSRNDAGELVFPVYIEDPKVVFSKNLAEAYKLFPQEIQDMYFLALTLLTTKYGERINAIFNQMGEPRAPGDAQAVMLIIQKAMQDLTRDLQGELVVIFPPKVAITPAEIMDIVTQGVDAYAHVPQPFAPKIGQPSSESDEQFETAFEEGVRRIRLESAIAGREELKAQGFDLKRVLKLAEAESLLLWELVKGCAYADFRPEIIIRVLDRVYIFDDSSDVIAYHKLIVEALNEKMSSGEAIEIAKTIQNQFVDSFDQFGKGRVRMRGLAVMVYSVEQINQFMETIVRNVHKYPAAFITKELFNLTE